MCEDVLENCGIHVVLETGGCLEGSISSKVPNVVLVPAVEAQIEGRVLGLVEGQLPKQQCRSERGSEIAVPRGKVDRIESG